MDEKDVLRLVDRLKPNLLKLVQELVRIPSENPPGDERDVARFLHEKFDELGYTVREYEVGRNRANVEARLRGKGGGRSVLFNGHTDVVPAGPRELWSKEPFGADFDGSRIWGRGTADMKGALASMVTALQALRESGTDLKGDVVVHAVADEEANSLGTKYMIEKKLVKADFAVVGEGSVANDSIYLRPAVRGICWITLRTKGKAAHASNPTNGVNAVLGMSKLLLELQSLPIPHKPHRILPPPTVAPGTTIRGGIKTNIIPPECYAEVDIRNVPGMKETEVVAAIENAAKRIQKENPGITAEIVRINWGASAELPEGHELLQIASLAAKRVTNVVPALKGGYGTNDSRLLINHAGVPTLCGFGPGDDTRGNAHAPDENVSLEMLVKFTKIYALMTLWICGNGRSS
ncbi:MAG TPA: M20 family metallopeptidase [Terriglobales bacterium]|nr:M20 family metallopeptidase [Terriglobales bacterium]